MLHFPPVFITELLCLMDSSSEKFKKIALNDMKDELKIVCIQK